MITPDLWNFLDFGRPKLAFALFQRFSFRIRLFYHDLPDHGEAWDKFTFILREASSRVLQIYLYITSSSTPDTNAFLGLKTAPFLADLYIFTPLLASSPSPIPAIYNMETPRLRHLELFHSHPCIPWTSRITQSHGLRTLMIQSSASEQPLELMTVLETLKHLSCLETLHWLHVPPLSTQNVSRTERLHMPSLRHVQLTNQRTTSIPALLECISFPIDVKISVAYRLHGDSDTNLCVLIWDAIANCCFHDNDKRPMGLSIHDQDKYSTIRCGHTTRSYTGITTFSGYAELEVLYNARFPTPAIDMLVSRAAVLPITMLELSDIFWPYNTLPPEWPWHFARWTQLQALRIVGDSTAEAFFKIIDQAMTASTDSGLFLLPNLKVIDYDGKDDPIRWPHPKYCWLEAFIRILSAWNRLFESGSRVSAVEHVYFQNMDPQYEEWKAYLEPLKVIVAVDCIST
jgi:hypothetical protein